MRRLLGNRRRLLGQRNPKAHDAGKSQAGKGAQTNPPAKNGQSRQSVPPSQAKNAAGGRQPDQQGSSVKPPPASNGAKTRPAQLSQTKPKGKAA